MSDTPKPRPFSDEDPVRCAAYEKWIAHATLRCHCADRFRPCDGVLAGGLCDNQQEEEPADDSDDAEEDARLWADDL